MLPLVGLPLVGCTCRPTYVMTQVFTVDACSTLNDTLPVATTAPSLVVKSHPAPLMLSVPTAVLNLKPAGRTRATVSPAASRPAAFSVRVGPVSVVQLDVPKSSAEIADPPVAGVTLTETAETVAIGTSEP